MVVAQSIQQNGVAIAIAAAEIPRCIGQAVLMMSVAFQAMTLPHIAQCIAARIAVTAHVTVVHQILVDPVEVVTELYK